MSEREEQAIQEYLISIFNTRNNILTFSFATVLATLGLAFAKDMDIAPFIYILPYFLLIPFTARIVYYRDAEARLNIALENSGTRKFMKIFNSKVRERNDGKFNIIGILVNYEMFILSLACLSVCILKYPKNISAFITADYLYFICVFLCVIIIFLMTSYTFSYKEIRDVYDDKWSKAEMDSLINIGNDNMTDK